MKFILVVCHIHHSRQLKLQKSFLFLNYSSFHYFQIVLLFKLSERTHCSHSNDNLMLGNIVNESFHSLQSMKLQNSLEIVAISNIFILSSVVFKAGLAFLSCDSLAKNKSIRLFQYQPL